jgi:hypothetical protein
MTAFNLQVVLTDYPDPDLITNLEWNVANNFEEDPSGRERVSVQVNTLHGMSRL